MSKDRLSNKDAALERFLKQLPESVRYSLTEEQLQAIQTALQVTQWRRHLVDIRLTIPLPWKKYYFVLVAGPERRSKQRRQAERARNPVWTINNLLFVASMFIIGILLVICIFQLKYLSFNPLTPPKETYPAGIPFKENREDCEESGRTWENNKCIDYTHDPTF